MGAAGCAGCAGCCGPGLAPAEFEGTVSAAGLSSSEMGCWKRWTRFCTAKSSPTRSTIMVTTIMTVAVRLDDDDSPSS